MMCDTFSAINSSMCLQNMVASVGSIYFNGDSVVLFVASGFIRSTILQLSTNS